ncbi:MAG TPA: metallophosphoesterase [Bacteroidales bacterium]|nr:metallophosphoesterase [Bacteroidales bacterium]
MSRVNSFLIFFSIVLTIYGLANLYLYRHLVWALPEAVSWGRALRWTLILVMLAFPLARTWMALRPSPLADGLYFVGALWMAAMLYLFLAFLMYDLARGFTWIIPGLRGDLSSPALRQWIATGVAALVLLLVAGGAVNAAFQGVSRMTLHTGKKANLDSLRVVMVSDIHMGSIIKEKSVKKMVEMVNREKPDLVVFTGDMFDDNPHPVIARGYGEHFRGIRSTYGMIGITGNHEHIGNASVAVGYLESVGMRILRDTAMLHESGIWIVGREDRDMSRFAGKTRKTLYEVMAGVDPSRPVLMLDHQPVELKEKADAGADLNLSGHTHDGQLWPLGHLAKAIYGISKGYKKLGEMHIYVSPGFGSWGPPVRIGNRPGIAVIDWRFGE